MSVDVSSQSPKAVILIYFYGVDRSDGVGFIVCEPKWDGDGWNAGHKIRGFDCPEEAEAFAQFLSDGEPIPLVIGGVNKDAVKNGFRAFEVALMTRSAVFDPTHGIEQ